MAMPGSRSHFPSVNDGDGVLVRREAADAELRDRLIAFEILARCEAWRLGDVCHSAPAKALELAQLELRRAIWAFGAAAATGVKPPVSTQLVGELHRLAAELRAHNGTAGSDPRTERLLLALDRLARTLQPRARSASPYRSARPRASSATSPQSSARPSDRDHHAKPIPPSRDDTMRAIAFVVLAAVGIGAGAAGMWLPSVAAVFTAWVVGLPPRTAPTPSSHHR